VITEKVAERLEKERIIWMTTVKPDGQPQSAPVWFVQEGEEIRVWSLDGERVKNIEQNPKVSLHLNDDGRGDNIVIIEAEATIDRSIGPGSAHKEFVVRYQTLLNKRTWDWFDRDYPVPLRIRPTRIRAW
jgi:PPOX class probable F420-dependent enzyme